MKLTKFNTIYQLAFLPNIFPINCYFVEEADHLVLIDAGMSFCKDHILAAAKEVGKPIRKIVLTHAHEDHVGALDGLVKEIPNVEVLISERDSKLLAGDISLLPEEAHLPIKGGIPKKINTIPTSYIEDGQQIGSLLAIHTPGHTPGHMAFLDTRNKSLIAGDAMQTRGGLAVSGQIKWSFPFPALATRDKETAIASVNRLLTYEPSLLATGHGPVILNPIEAMQAAVKKANV